MDKNFTSFPKQLTCEHRNLVTREMPYYGNSSDMVSGVVYSLVCLDCFAVVSAALVLKGDQSAEDNLQGTPLRGGSLADDSASEPDRG